MKISAARLNQISLLALLVAGSVLIASEASADAKLVPATVCQPLVQINTNPLETQAAQDADEADALERIANIRYSFNGRVLNQSRTKKFGVVCPIVRDNLDRRLNWIRVIYVDQHPTDTLDCELRAAEGVATVPSARDPESTANYIDIVKVPGVGNGVWHFQLDNVGSTDGGDINNLNFYYSIGHYTLICQIPPRASGTLGEFSWIAGIMIDEP